MHGCSAAAADYAYSENAVRVPVPLITEVHVLNGYADTVGDNDGRASEVTSSEVAECDALRERFKWRVFECGYELGEVQEQHCVAAVAERKHERKARDLILNLRRLQKWQERGRRSRG